LNAREAPPPVQALAEALLRASEQLSDHVLRNLPALPDEAAAAMVDRPFADRVPGVYLAWAWFEPYCVALRFPIADLDDGWDISDGQQVYWCPRVLLADDPHTPEERRAFVRVDKVRQWPDPEARPAIPDERQAETSS